MGAASADFGTLTETTHGLWAINFGFDIPETATITGVEVEVRRRAQTGSVSDDFVRLIRNSSLVGDDLGKVGPWSTSYSYVRYGGEASSWGASWTPADINATGFGVAVTASGLLNDMALVDHIRITVSYAETCE
jgi:hypothetical protein